MTVGTGRPKQGYFSKAGHEVPGTTTVIKAMESSPALIAWAVSLAKKGKDHDEVRERAANIGILSHDVIHSHVLGKDRPEVPEDIAEDVTKRLDRFLPWYDQYKPRVVLAEVPLVSEAHAFGGTPDLVADIDTPPGDMGHLIMTDYKTSNTGPYPGWFAQLGAYSILYEETQGKWPDGGCVVHVSERRLRHAAYWVNSSQLTYCADHFLGLLKEYNRRHNIESWFKKRKKNNA